MMTTQQFLSKPYVSEDQFTANYSMWVNNNFPPLRNFYFHIPNELSMIDGESKASFSRRLSRHMACGVLPGVFDFEFKLPYVWHLELKMPGKTFSPSQAKLYEIWTKAGIVVELVDTPEKAVAATLKHCQQYYRGG